MTPELTVALFDRDNALFQQWLKIPYLEHRLVAHCLQIITDMIFRRLVKLSSGYWVKPESKS